MIFRLTRVDYSKEAVTRDNPGIKRTLQAIFENKSIIYDRMYDPNRDSIKVFFPIEKEIEKVIKNFYDFTAKHYNPVISQELRASRTVFCTKLDQTLLSTYNKDEIKDILKNQGWNVNEVIITKSKKSFRIVMTDRNQAQKYINSTDTAIGGIKITEENKEPEIDPTIK